ncbi:MAG: acyltransferase [Candidatus Pedobacter colombiensis]|uniref:Acyltransferase n=1 Tax=Candidatus Pedobacter colombiensis TaxID=3121371 RepID=A0AAJ5WAB3_9SPHI|nr:acyltransferase [Pedobacter sp.]WEK19182.1 MAG: acyltransferase [Pedobacter sp.]
MELVKTKRKGKNFEFVDTIRCISMIGIVFEHCTMIGEPHYENFYSSMFQASVMQFFKFSTIAFFLIAGFLINHKFTEYTPWEYLKNRFKNTIKPWLLWINVLIALNVITLIIKCFRRGWNEFPSNFYSYLLEQYHHTIFFTSFWFILNFLICIGILLIFKKYIYKLWFGVVLAIVSLFYSVNLYHKWIITSHSTALFGFVFYLWLGVILNKYYDQFNLWLSRVSIWIIVAVTCLFFLFADLEAVYLRELGINDAYNTLRFTNILYSLFFFLLLLKNGPISMINKYLNPRETTFGIYLVHWIIITHAVGEIFRPFKYNMNTITLIDAMSYSILRFLVTYMISFGLVTIIRHTSFKWSIGAG